METTVSSSAAFTHSKSTSHAPVQSKFWDMLEFNRFGVIAMLLTIVGCVGGIAVAYGAHNELFQIALVAFPTIITLALILAVAPMRLLVWLTGLALVIDMLVLIF